MWPWHARVMRKDPRRWTAITASQSSSLILKIRLSRMMPALLTSTLGAPSSVVTRSTAAPTAAASATSTPTPSARPPLAVIASTVPAHADSSRSSTATANPSCARRVATAAPMPRAAPVTTATRWVLASVMSASPPARPAARQAVAGNLSGGLDRVIRFGRSAVGVLRRAPGQEQQGRDGGERDDGENDEEIVRRRREGVPDVCHDVRLGVRAQGEAADVRTGRQPLAQRGGRLREAVGGHGGDDRAEGAYADGAAQGPAEHRRPGDEAALVAPDGGLHGDHRRAGDQTQPDAGEEADACDGPEARVGRERQSRGEPGHEDAATHE